MIQQYTIGRGDNCQVRVQDPGQRISRSHATLKMLDNGKFFITDHSSNGTWVNGVKIAPNVDYPVKRGDTISFANVAELNWALIPKKANNKRLIFILAGAFAALVIVAACAFFINQYNRPCVQPIEEPSTSQTDTIHTPETETIQVKDSVTGTETKAKEPEKKTGKEPDQKDDAKKDAAKPSNKTKPDSEKTIIY